MSVNCDVGAARCILSPSTSSIAGTNIIPPPTPNRLDMIPAPKVAANAADRNVVERFLAALSFRIEFLYST